MLSKFWEFAEKRIDLMRTGETKDPVLKEYRFTNCHRACDRVSQYLIRNVCECSYDDNDLLWRIFMFKIFNKIETWEYLSGLVSMHLENFDVDIFDEYLTNKDGGRKLYSAAFRQPIGESLFGYRERYRNHLRMINYCVRNCDILVACMHGTKELYHTLCRLPMLGAFIAMQFATDLGYSKLTPHRSDLEDQFVQPGPGCRRGVAKCWNLDHKDTYGVIDRLVHTRDVQPASMTILGRRLSLMDVQNMYCEFDKYLRVVRPELNMIGRRRAAAVRPKQKYRPNPSGRLVWPIDYRFPTKWMT